MKLPKILLVMLCFSLQSGVAFGDLGIAGKGKKIVVFTDYEADDSVAIGLLLTHLKAQGVQTSHDFMFDALLSNQYRKKALVQNLVRLFGYADDTVYAGTGGIKDPFAEEGQNILDEGSLTNLLTLDHQCDEAITQFDKILKSATPNSIDVLMLTNPKDLVKALDSDTDSLKKYAPFI